MMRRTPRHGFYLLLCYAEPSDAVTVTEAERGDNNMKNNNIGLCNREHDV